MRETENLEFIAVGPWGVPSPCVRTSRVLCRKTVCGPRSTGRFLYSLTLRPLPLSNCRVPCTDDCVECVRRRIFSHFSLPHESARARAPAVRVSCL